MNRYTELANRLDKIMLGNSMTEANFNEAQRIIAELKALHDAGERYQGGKA